jgi:Lipase (class 3)
VHGRELKLIKVVFRGSVTIEDWKTNFKMSMKSVPNPSDGSATASFVSIHRGFYKYLLGAPAGSRSKYETIINHIQKIRQDQRYKDYKIRVSGHSLGGALATVFAFHAVSHSDLPKPVTCISFASPRVGNLAFARAFQKCEFQGSLRSIRVANKKDLVPKVPERLLAAATLTMCTYWHVGIELNLRDKESDSNQNEVRIRFPVHHRTLSQHVAKAGTVGRKVWKVLNLSIWDLIRKLSSYPRHHSCEEYSDRLAGAAEYLQSMTVDSLVKEHLDHQRLIHPHVFELPSSQQNTNAIGDL